MVHVKAGSQLTKSVPGDDALRELCFSDAVFRTRYDGWGLLGRGPWASVVKTRSQVLGNDIALKVFVNLDPDLLERVRHEVRAVQALATPYLVHAYSLFDRGAVAWFEMELVDGPNLQQELDRLAAAGERLPMLRAYEIALAVSRCLWHAHRHGVLHRDIKPANVLLPASGQPPAKLGDFGVARLAELAGSTPPGAVTGTPRFASPEALAGEPVGLPHDVYSLGATLYALFTGGQLPYRLPRDASFATLRRIQLENRPTPLREAGTGVDAIVERVVSRTLAPDPAARPAVHEVVLTIERARARCVRGAATDASLGAPPTSRSRGAPAVLRRMLVRAWRNIRELTWRGWTG